MDLRPGDSIGGQSVMVVSDRQGVSPPDIPTAMSLETDAAPLPLCVGAVATVVGTGVWLASYVRPVSEIASALAANGLLIVPLGWLIVRAVLPTRERQAGQAARAALVLTTGYAATTLVALLLGELGLLAIMPLLYAALVAAWIWSTRATVLQVWRRPKAPPTSLCVVVIITCLGLVAITPLMTPIRTAASGNLVSYAYIDAYQSLGFLQSLTRHIPALENAGLAGVPSRLYPDFHYTYLAILQRTIGATASDVYFVHGSMLLVLLGTPLAYATGREMTGTRLGGYVTATMLYVGVVPNLYDLNPTLAAVPLPFMPTFNQSHFYSPRFNQHEGAGALIVLSAGLCLAIAGATRDERTRFRGLLLGGVFVGLLARFRSQHLLSMGPAFVAVSVALAWKRRNRSDLVGIVSLGVTVAALWLQSFDGGYDEGSANLVVRYGTVGVAILNGWFLPARLHAAFTALPAAIAPAVAVVAMVAFRYVGMNLGLFMAARWTRLAVLRRPGTWPEAFWLLGIASAIVTALLIERDTLTIGLQILQITHVLSVLLAAPAVYGLVRVASDRLAGRTYRQWAAGAAVLLTLTGVAWRGAEAALHDQPRRAYPISQDEREAYHWLRTSTPYGAVVAVHPDHTVNEDREPVTRVNMLSALTDRRVYLQRTGRDQRAIALERATRLRALFAAESDTAVCAAATQLPVDFVIAYADTPLTAAGSRCVPEVFRRGDTRIYRLQPDALP